MTGASRDSSSVSRATIHKFRRKRSITPDSKTASRDRAAVRAPPPSRLASPVRPNAFVGALTRGSIGTIPATQETENRQRHQGILWLGDLDSNQD